MVDFIYNYRGPIIESGNWAFTIGWLLLGFYVAWRQSRSRMTDGNHAILVNVGWMAIGSGLNSLWFSISRNIAPTGELWHPSMFDLRHYAVALTAIVFAWGASGALIEFLEWGQVSRVCVFAGVLITALTLGVY